MNRSRFRWILLGLAPLVAWLGCVRKPPPGPSLPQPAQPAIRVPAGCLDDLSGTYIHALNPSYQYLAADDGGTLFLALERVHSDAGVSPSDPNRIWVSLSRTAKGFVGDARATVYVASGRTCPVDFPTELIGCEDGGLVLKSAVGSSVNEESCQPSQASAHALMGEHHLIRTRPMEPARPAEDAGLQSAD